MKKNYPLSVGRVIALTGACSRFRRATRNVLDAKSLYYQIQDVDLLRWFWDRLYVMSVIKKEVYLEIVDYIKNVDRESVEHNDVAVCALFRERYPFPQREYDRLERKLRIYSKKGA